jgi:hypothetical protein
LSGKGYNILLNPAYFYNESAKRGARTTRIIAICAVVISFLSLFKDNFNCNNKAPEEIKINLQMPKQAKDTEIVRAFPQKTDSLSGKTK